MQKKNLFTITLYKWCMYKKNKTQNLFKVAQGWMRRAPSEDQTHYMTELISQISKHITKNNIS